MACQVTSFSFGADGGGTAEICVAAPNVAPVACVDDSVCLETNRVCNDLVGDGQLSLQCGFPGTGAALGEGCASTSLADRDGCATGLCDGLNLGLNARAALITRGLAEITRLGMALGAKAETFMGLSGLGDLVLTATGDLSRNRKVGLALAQVDFGYDGAQPPVGRILPACLQRVCVMTTLNAPLPPCNQSL